MAKRAESGEMGAAAGPRAAGSRSAGSRAAAKAAPTKAATPKAATPWGQATVVEEVKVAQRAGDRRFTSHVQLLESDRGEPLIRIAYATGGVVRRGPVTLRPKDVEHLRAALASGSALAAALGWSQEVGGSQERGRGAQPAGGDA